MNIVLKLYVDIDVDIDFIVELEQIPTSAHIASRMVFTAANTYEEVLTISVTDVNEAPTQLDISNATLAENAGANATVGTLSASDPDAGSTFTYAFVSGQGDADNALFTISGSSLKAISSLDFESQYVTCFISLESALNITARRV